MKNWLFRIPLFSFIYFVLLFDEDGAQLGASLFDVPSAITQTASIFGNIFWLFGGIMLIVGVILFIMANDKDVTQKTLKEYPPGEKRDKLLKRAPVAQAFGIVTTLFAIGSGFWFYGLGALVVTLGLHVWLGELKKEAEKIDEENGVEKPFSALDLAKENLLND